MEGKYGELTVLKQLEKRSSNGSILFLCRCSCGNTCEVTRSHLICGHTVSCGCKKNRIKDYSGQMFNNVKIIKLKSIENKRTYYTCLCSCGNEFIARIDQVLGGDTKSCGCLSTKVRKETIKERIGIKNGTNLSLISPKRKPNKNNKSSNHIGVSYDKKRAKWVAQITFKRVSHSLGRYDTYNEAVQAREAAEKYYFAEELKNRR